MNGEKTTALRGERMQVLFGWLVRELRTVPVTLCFMVLLSYTVWGLQKDHVSVDQFSALSQHTTDQFDSLKKQMVSIQYVLQHDHLDTRIHQVEDNLFSLTQHTNEAKEKGLQIDPFMYERINELTRQDENLKREISILEQAKVPQ